MATIDTNIVRNNGQKFYVYIDKTDQKPQGTNPDLVVWDCDVTRVGTDGSSTRVGFLLEAVGNNTLNLVSRVLTQADDLM